MGSAEFAEWLAYEKEYGLPDAYFITARLGATIDGAMTGRSKPASEYVPYFWTPPRRQTVAEQRAIMRSHLAAARAKRV